MTTAGAMSSSTQSQKASAAQLGLLEKMTIIPNLAMAYAAAFAAIFSGVLKGSDQRPPQYYKHVMYTLIRTVVNRMSIRQFHAISPPTDAEYANLCKRKGMAPKSEVLEDGTTAHWIGSSSAEYVIINFHGGGYVLPAGWAYLEFMWQLQDFLTKEGKDVAVLFLSYDLAPTARYPRQLQQAAALLHHTVHNLQKLPENIILSGDSAGGNLVLALLSHISHPHPSTTHPITPIKLSAPLRAVVLTSPWVSFDSSTPAFKRNAPLDLLDGPGALRWAEAFMGTPAPHILNADNYNQAIQAPDEWWADLQVKQILIVAGAEEILIDSIEDFAKTMKRVKGEENVTVLVAKGEAHDMTNLDVQLGYRKPGQQASLIRSWVASKL